MKLGPIEVKLSRSAPAVEPTIVELADSVLKIANQSPNPTRPRMGEIGATGTQIFGGLMVQQDYNLDLQGPRMYKIYDQMRRSDGQVRAGLSVIKLPLLRVDWTIEPASDSAEDKNIAEFLSEDLFHNLSMPWPKTLRQILMALDYGCMPFEPVWTLGDDQMVHLRKLAQRLPSTIMKWYVDDNGGLAGIQQMAYKGSRSEMVDIPVEKLVVFINEQEGADFRGVSVLRAAYKHWYIKDKLYIVDAIAKEKRSIGVDVGTLKGTPDQDRIDDAEKALMRMHGHEKQFITEIEDEFIYRVEGVTGRFTEALASIEHHDSRILRSILAEFLAMGERQTSSASQGMRRDNSSFFMMALGAIADEVVSCAVNEYLIKRWVDYNWNVKKYPRLVHERLETRDTQQLAGAVARLVNVGAITPDGKTENALRVVFELPTIDENAPRPEPLPKVPPGGPPQPINQPPQNPYKNNPQVQKVAATLDSIRQEQATKLSQVGQDIFTKGQWDRVEDVNVPFRSRAAESVKFVLLSLSAADADDRSAALEARLLVELMSERMYQDFVTVMKGATTHYEADAMKERLLKTPINLAVVDEAIQRVTT